MSYASFDYYRSEYGGTMIEDADTYRRISAEADAYLDKITMGRIEITDDTNAATITAICNAACSIAEITMKQAQDEEPTVTSESVGNHSRGFSRASRSESEREGEKYRKAALFLARTGLLYRGMR